MARVICSTVTRIGSETRRDLVCCEARKLLFKCKDSSPSDFLLLLLSSVRSWWEFRSVRPIWTYWDVRFWE